MSPWALAQNDFLKDLVGVQGGWSVDLDGHGKLLLGNSRGESTAVIEVDGCVALGRRDGGLWFARANLRTLWATSHHSNGAGHRLHVFWGGAAAAADELHARFKQASRVDAEMLGIGYVDGATIDLRGLSCIGLHGDGCATPNHLGGDLVQRIRAGAAVHTDDMRASANESLGHGRRIQPTLGEAVLLKGEMGDYWNLGGSATAFSNGRFEFHDGRKGFQANDIDTGLP
jgi:hypothetical protein